MVRNEGLRSWLEAPTLPPQKKRTTSEPERNRLVLVAARLLCSLTWLLHVAISLGTGLSRAERPFAAYVLASTPGFQTVRAAHQEIWKFYTTRVP